MSSLTVQSAYNSFSRYKKDITDVSVTLFSEWCDWINKYVYRMLYASDPERFMATSTITTTSGTSSYALPSDFRSIDVFGTGIFKIDSSNLTTNQQLPRTSVGSTASGYYISKSNIIITPVPTETKYYTLRYIPTISTISALSSYFTTDALTTGNIIIDSEYLNMLVKVLDTYYNEWDEDTGMEGVASARFMNVMDEFIRTIKKESNNIFMPDFSADYLSTSGFADNQVL